MSTSSRLARRSCRSSSRRRRWLPPPEPGPPGAIVPELALRLERLNTVFGVELAERIRTVNALILQLERANDFGALGPLARQLHSLEGAARPAGSRSIRHAGHS